MKIFLKNISMLILVCIAGISLSGCMTDVSIAAGQGSSGTVTISYILYKIPKIASNQIAVWIEDENGNYIKTLYSTRFTARGGFKKRPQALPEWVKISDWVNRSQAEIDAVSGATQQAGKNELLWDLTDSAGKTIAAGTYVYKIEGIIYWENRVIWQGRINVGGEENTSIAEATYFPQNTNEGGILLEQVKAAYNP